MSNKAILIVLPLIGAVAAFWFLALAPKREEAALLAQDRDRLEASVSQINQQVAIAEQTRDDFPRAYKRLVVLGKAVPEDADTPSLFVELNSIGKTNKAEFRSIELQSAGQTPEPPPPPPDAGSDGAATPTEESGQVPASDAAPPAAPPTEAAAAVLPIGASVGPAGLPVMPYTLEYRGSFFDLADFMGDIDGLVSVKDGRTRISGRLVTVDGFVFTADPDKGFPDLEANYSVTTYLVPPGEGVALGASPSAPAPVDPAGGPTPASNPSVTP